MKVFLNLETLTGLDHDWHTDLLMRLVNGFCFAQHSFDNFCLSSWLLADFYFAHSIYALLVTHPSLIML